MAGEYDASGVLQTRYVSAGGGDDPLVEYDRGTGGTYTRTWLLPDERGSIVSHSDDTGTSTGINAYDEYGVPAAGNTGRFGYTGQAWLPELGLWYYKARMYAPALGRFLQTDPIGYGDGANWYDYAKSDPINGSDPGGLASTIGGCTGSIACTGTFSPGSIGIGTTGASGARADAMTYLEQAGFSGDTAEAAVNLATAYGSAAAALRVVTGDSDDVIVIGHLQPSYEWISIPAVSALPAAIGNMGLGQAWIDYLYPGFYTHVAAGHFGRSTLYKSVFEQKFQNEGALYSLAAFAANAAPMRPTDIPNYYRYTATYSSYVGRLQGSDAQTRLITLIVRDSFQKDDQDREIYIPVTLYPGAALDD